MTFIKKLILVGLVACSALTPIQALSSKINFENVDYSHYLTRLSPNDGLSQANISHILQDDQGYMWFGSLMGLNRYDGYNITLVSGPNNVFSREEITSLFKCEQGFLWVGTSLSGMYKLNPQTLEATQILPAKNPQTDTYQTVNKIVGQDNEHLILGIDNKVYQMRKKDNQLSMLLTVDEESHIVRDMLLEGRYLYVASSAGMFRYDLESKKTIPLAHRPNGYDVEDSENAKSLKVDKELGLLIGTVRGLFSIADYNKLVPGEGKVLIEEKNIWDIESFEQGYILGTNIGVYFYNPTEGKLQLTHRYSRSLFQTSDDNVLTMFLDRQQNLWMGSKSLGVLKWSVYSRGFANIGGTNLKGGLSNENVWALYERNNILWVGTDNGLNKIDLADKSVTIYNASKDNKYPDYINMVTGIAPKDDNSLWVQTVAGLRSFDINSGQYEILAIKNDTEASPFKQMSWSHFRLDNNRILFINLEGAFIYDSENYTVTKLDALSDALNIEWVEGFLKPQNAPKDTIYVRSYEGLFQFNYKNNEVKQIFELNDPNNIVSDIAFDNDNIMWLAVRGEGIVGLDSTTFEEKYRFDQLNGLSTNFVYTVKLDESNYLWATSQKGIIKISETREQVVRFVAHDGFLSSEFNEGAHASLSDGRFAFGSPRGVTIVYPDILSRNELLPEDISVNLTGIKLLSDESRTFNDYQSVTLEYDDFGLKLEFSTLIFAKQNEIQYNISFNGGTDITLSQVDANELIVPKLAPGKYELNITAADPLTGRPIKPAKLMVKVNSPPWATPLAKFFYVTSLSFMLGAFWYSRHKRHVERLNAHRKLRASENQMQLALQSSSSGIWDYRIEIDTLYEARLYDELGHKDLTGGISIRKRMALVHPDDISNVKTQWQAFVVGQNKTWDISYRLKDVSGNWLWYREVGKVIKYDEQNKPVRLIGTYTNITNSKASELRAQLFGEAFSQINDWVLILDRDKRPVTANNAFLQAFNIKDIGSNLDLKVVLDSLSGQKYDEFTEIIRSLGPKDSWQGEEVLETAESKSHPVLIKINAIENGAGDISHYVVVISDITVQKQAEEKLRHLAHYDFLTDLPNRKLVLEKIEQKTSDNTNKFALFFIDLDKFKQVNDLYGHLVGDKLLKHVASILTNLVSLHDLVARQSGDEFIILVEDYETLDDLGHLAENINAELSKTLEVDTHLLNVTSSVGIAIYPEDGTSATELIQKADIAMMHVKQQGRGEFQFYTQDMNELAHNRLVLESKLRNAAKNKEFINFYQPVVDSIQQKLIGVELLLRWKDEGELIPPSVFIPIAEEIGIVASMTVDAVDQALADYKVMLSKHADLYISVNLSPVHILQDGLQEDIEELLEKHKLPASVLRFEITENTLMVDLDLAFSRLNQLRKKGFKLLLDDFGTGYSSMTYLSRFPIDFIKVDRSFTTKLEDKSNFSIVKSIVTLADNLDMECIVEGVENHNQLHVVNELGCRYIQGFFYSKPLPLGELLFFTFPYDKCN